MAVATPVSPRSITRLRYGDVYAVDLATSATTRLTDAPGWDGSPAWSRDGASITFYSERGRRLDHLNTALWVMNADGSQQRALAAPAAVGALSRQYLPDGRIVYARRTKPYPGSWDEPGTWQIVSVQPNGEGLTTVSTASPTNYWAPTAGPMPGSIVAHGTGPSSDGDERLLVDGAPYLRSILGTEVELYPLRANLGIALHPFEPLVLQQSNRQRLDADESARRRTTPARRIHGAAQPADRLRLVPRLRVDRAEPRRRHGAVQWTNGRRRLEDARRRE